MHFLSRLQPQVFFFKRSIKHLQMASYSSSIQPGSYVTHPSLYAQSSREELLARIAELERSQARIIISNSKSHQEIVSHDAVTASDTPVASPSTSTLDHPRGSTSAIASTSLPAQHQCRAERKALLRKRSKPDITTSNEKQQSDDSNANADTFFDRYPSRKIALRFCYEGWLYGGLALQNDEPPSGIYLPPSTRSNSTQCPPCNSNTKGTSGKATPSKEGSVNKALPTVEGVLLDALVASRLIKESDKRDFEKLDFSRCGRTDRGVSAAGQVISLYVRSQVDEKDENGIEVPGWRNAVNPLESDEMDLDSIEDLEERKKIELKKVKKRNELPYMSLLNRVLPNSIRILGWSPVDETFDSRFSCTHRHYKYFFTASRTSSASPTSSSTESTDKRSSTSITGRRNPGLDVKRMQDAANKLVGEHDFRNLCKVDATKQITNFYRRVTSATISPVDSTHTLNGTIDGGVRANERMESRQHEEDMYVFDLKGSAFLYHQVRHIMAILFLVGSGHEEPSVVDALLNTGYESERPLLDPSLKNKDPNLPIISSKPAYEMASDLPLVLWDCQFKKESNLRWQQDELIQGQDLRDSKGYLEMKYENTQLRIKEAISSHFMRAYLETGHSSSSTSSSSMEGMPVKKQDKKKDMFEIQLGGGKTARAGKYTPLLMRGRSDPVEVINERWASGQGKRRAERKARAEGIKEE